MSRYVSIDIETLGLDSDYSDTIELGAVIDDLTSDISDLPRFHAYVTLPDNKYRGEAYAMSMHSTILRRIATREQGYTYIPFDMIGEEFEAWLLTDHGPWPKNKAVVAGKNFAGFDLQFLKQLPGFNTDMFHYRSLDPGSMFFDPKIDEVPPGLEICLQRAGLNTPVNHTAVEDALDVIRCIRYKVRNAGSPYIPAEHVYRLYEEFQDEGPYLTNVFDTIADVTKYVQQREGMPPFASSCMFHVIGPDGHKWAWECDGNGAAMWVKKG